MNVPEPLYPPDGELFWQDYDSQMLTKINEVIAYLKVHHQGENNQPGRTFELTSIIEQENCAHEHNYQMKPGVMRCKDCKKIYKV